MRTLITTFAIAVMVFAFNTTTSYANEESNKKADKDLAVLGDPFINLGKWMHCTVGTNTLDHICDEQLRTGDFSENEQGKDETLDFAAIDETLDFAYALELWCGKNKALREAICSKDGFEWIKQQFAGLTRRQKQQQDEDDWNAWILQQFAAYEHLDSDSRDGSGGRNVADSGEEGSTSAAGTDEQ